MYFKNSCDELVEADFSIQLRFNAAPFSTCALHGCESEIGMTLYLKMFLLVSNLIRFHAFIIK